MKTALLTAERCLYREAGTYTEEEALRVGREAGEQLKAEAGPEFMSWSH